MENLGGETKFNYNLDSWSVLNSYFKDRKRLTREQLESYNDFMDNVFPQIIKRNNPIVISTGFNDNLMGAGKGGFEKRYKVTFGLSNTQDTNDIYIAKPIIHENTDNIQIMTPAMALKRDLTYSSSMYIDVKQEYETYNPASGTYDIVKSSVDKKVFIGKIPTMIQSKYCHLSNLSPTERVAMGECMFDNGGYFIVNGSEKVVVAQECIRENKVFVFVPNRSPSDKYKWRAEIKSSIDQRFYPIKSNFVGMTPDPPIQKVMEQLFNEKQQTKAIGKLFKVHIPMFKEDIPLFILFKALGVSNDKDIYTMIVGDLEESANYINTLYYSSEECREKGILTQEQALTYLASKIKNNPYSTTFSSDTNDKGLTKDTYSHAYVRKLLDTELLPHLGINMYTKSVFLGYMTKKLLDVASGVRPEDKRDNYANKRLDLTGILLSQIVRTEWHNLTRLIRTTISHHLSSATAAIELYGGLRKLIEKNNIETRLVHCLATGNWGGTKGAADTTKKGIAQVLDRKSYPSTLSHRRRIVSPLAQSGSKIVAPRRVDATHFHMNCIDETPEGSQVGIVKNLALQCHVSIYSSEYQIKFVLGKIPEFIPLDKISIANLSKVTKIFLNGSLLGGVIESECSSLYDRFRTYKRHAIINPYVSIAWYIEWNEIFIQTDGGRYMRPLFIVNPQTNELQVEKKFNNDESFRTALQNKTMPWSQLVAGKIDDGEKEPESLYNGGVIEYLDTTEIETNLIARNAECIKTFNEIKAGEVYLKYTHCEINATMQKGVVAQMIPFSNHNQSPRNLYQSSMGKQAIGYYVTNYNSRMDTMAHILVYGHKAPCSTRTMQFTLMDQLPHGVATNLVYLPYYGYNQEDATILNKDSVERGMFNTLFFRTYKDQAQTHKGTSVNSERFGNPSKTEKVAELRHGSYEHINDKGQPIEGHTVDEDDIVIGKLIEVGKDRKTTEFNYRDMSNVIKQNEGGLIDRTMPGNFHPFKEVRNVNSEGHEFIKARVSCLRQPESGDKFACYDDQTEVLTNNGWKYFNDLNKTDKVASLNSDGFGMSYSSINEIMSYDVVNQDMYLVDTQQINLLVTPNHRMYIKRRERKSFEIITAENIIGKRYKFKKNCNYVPEQWIGEKFTFPSMNVINMKGSFHKEDYTINMNDWLLFLGIWFAEGWTDQGNVVIAANKNRVQVELCKLAQNLDWHLIKDESSKKWKLKNTQVFTYLNQLSVGAINKQLPDWVWNLNQEQSRILLNGMCLGDGYLTKSNTQMYYTSSIKLANDVQRLALHCGWSANLTMRIKAGTPYTIVDHSGFTNADAYAITIIKEKNEPQINHGHSNEQQDEMISYTGKVYCCAVDTIDGIIYVRRQGKPVWCGNSRHSQKGCTGLITSQINLPFTTRGICPDIIMNPHGIPSRMTYAQILETFMGKICIARAELQDGTPFVERSVKSYFKCLEAFGFNKTGNEVMYNGRTGQMYEAEIFCGPTYYQRLKHMVIDKIHSRESGPVQILTRQPAEGRARDGGLRLGEMERDVVIAHGAEYFLKERTVDCSDKFSVFVSKQHKTIITGNREKGLFQFAGKALPDDDVVEIQLPYAMKLAMQELTCMGIDIRLNIDEKTTVNAK